MVGIKQLKQEGYDLYIKKSIADRLASAEFGDSYFGQTEYLGNIFVGSARI